MITLICIFMWYVYSLIFATLHFTGLCIQSSSPTELRVEVDGSALLSVIVNVSECDFTWHKNEEQLLGGIDFILVIKYIL